MTPLDSAMASGSSGSVPVAVPEEDAPGIAVSRRAGRNLEAQCCGTMTRALRRQIAIPSKLDEVAPHDGRGLPRLRRTIADAKARLHDAKEALAEQRILAREADHRVANALQLVHGVLSLQAEAAPDGEAREAIRAAARSVAAAAEAHRHLYSSTAARLSPDTAPDAVVYLSDLVRKLSPTPSPNRRGVHREVTLRAQCGLEGGMTAGLLPRLGLITAELVSNALKHGAGPVLVELSPGRGDDGGGVVVAVSDDGAGFPATFNPAVSREGSLGMRLLVSLARPGRVWVDPTDCRRIVVHLKARAATAA